MATIDDVYVAVGDVKSMENTLYTVDASGKIVALYDRVVTGDISGKIAHIRDVVDHALADQYGRPLTTPIGVPAVEGETLTSLLEGIAGNFPLAGVDLSGLTAGQAAITASLSAVSAAVAAAQASVAAVPAAAAEATTTSVNWLGVAAGVTGVAAAVLSPEFGLVELAGLLGGVNGIVSSIETKVDALADSAGPEFDPVPSLGWVRLSQALVDIWQQASDANSNTVDIKNTLGALSQLSLDLQVLRDEVAHITSQVDHMRSDLSVVRPRVVRNMPYAGELLLSSTHPISDTGIINLDANVIAASIEFTDIPPGLTKDKGSPAAYKGMGIVAVGNSRGWDKFGQISRATNLILIGTGYDRITWAVRPDMGGVLREYVSSEG